MKKPKFVECDMIFPVFSNFRVKIVISPDLPATHHWVTERDGITRVRSMDKSEAFTVKLLDRGIAYIFLEPDAAMGTIAHEAYHATTALLDCIGSNGRDDEMTAYHLGYIVDKAVEFNFKVAGRFKIAKSFAEENTKC